MRFHFSPFICPQNFSSIQKVFLASILDAIHHSQWTLENSHVSCGIDALLLLPFAFWNNNNCKQSVLFVLQYCILRASANANANVFVFMLNALVIQSSSTLFNVENFIYLTLFIHVFCAMIFIHTWRNETATINYYGRCSMFSPDVFLSIRKENVTHEVDICFLFCCNDLFCVYKTLRPR